MIEGGLIYLSLMVLTRKVFTNSAYCVNNPNQIILHSFIIESDNRIISSSSNPISNSSTCV